MFRTADEMAVHLYEKAFDRLNALERISDRLYDMQLRRLYDEADEMFRKPRLHIEPDTDMENIANKARKLLSIPISTWDREAELRKAVTLLTSSKRIGDTESYLKALRAIFLLLHLKEKALDKEMTALQDEVRQLHRRMASYNALPDRLIEAATGMYGYTKAVSSAGERATKQLHKEAVRIAKAAYSKDASVVDFLAKHAEKGGSRTARVLLKAMEDIGPRIPSLPDKEASGTRSLYGFRRKTADLGIAACSQLKLAAGDVAASLGDKWAKRYADMIGFLSRHAEEGRCLYAGMLVSCFPDGGSSLAKTASPASKLEDYLRQGAFGKAEEEAGKILQGPLTRDLTRLIPRLKANQTMGTNIKALVQALMASNS